MHISTPTTRLWPRQTRLIHACEGLRIRVVCGRMWLTQPGAAQDLFLGPGDSLDLLQDWVVVEADAVPSQGAAGTMNFSAYELHPIAVPTAQIGWLGALVSFALRWRARVGAFVPLLRRAPVP